MKNKDIKHIYNLVNLNGKKSPGEVLIDISNDEELPPALRKDAAVALLPYCHEKIAPDYNMINNTNISQSFFAPSKEELQIIENHKKQKSLTNNIIDVDVSDEL